MVLYRAPEDASGHDQGEDEQGRDAHSKCSRFGEQLASGDDLHEVNRRYDDRNAKDDKRGHRQAEPAGCRQYAACLPVA